MTGIRLGYGSQNSGKDHRHGNEHVWPDVDEVLDQLQKSIRDAQDARKKLILFHVQSFEVTY